MIQNKVHKCGQLITINNHVYRITKYNNNSKYFICKYCDTYCTNDCLSKIGFDNLCWKVMKLKYFLKRIDNVKSK